MERRLIGPWGRLMKAKEVLLDRVGHLSAGSRDRRPTPESWSITDVVEHLTLVERGLATSLAKAPNPERPRVVPWGQGIRFGLMRAALKAGVRIKAPVIEVLPSRDLPWHALLARWEEQRRELEEWLLSVDPAVLLTPRFRHPIAGWLHVPQALTFAGDHLEHHFGQVERIIRGVP